MEILVCLFITRWVLEVTENCRVCVDINGVALKLAFEHFMI